MSFVRKPRPYSSGLPSAPSLPQAAPRRARREPVPRPASGGPRSGWATAVTALAVLGTVLILLVGLSGLVNQLWRDAQFRSAAAGISDVQH